MTWLKIMAVPTTAPCRKIAERERFGQQRSDNVASKRGYGEVVEGKPDLCSLLKVEATRQIHFDQGNHLSI